MSLFYKHNALWLCISYRLTSALNHEVMVLRINSLVALKSLWGQHTNTMFISPGPTTCVRINHLAVTIPIKIPVLIFLMPLLCNPSFLHKHSRCPMLLLHNAQRVLPILRQSWSDHVAVSLGHQVKQIEKYRFELSALYTCLVLLDIVLGENTICKSYTCNISISCHVAIIPADTKHWPAV